MRHYMSVMAAEAAATATAAAGETDSTSRVCHLSCCGITVARERSREQDEEDKCWKWGTRALAVRKNATHKIMTCGTFNHDFFVVQFPFWTLTVAFYFTPFLLWRPREVSPAEGLGKLGQPGKLYRLYRLKDMCW